MGANARRTAIAALSTIALVLSMGGVASAKHGDHSRTVVQPTLTLNAFPSGKAIAANGVYDNVSPACLGPGNRAVVILVNGGFGAIRQTAADGSYSALITQLNQSGHGGDGNSSDGHGGDGHGGDGHGGDGNHGDYKVQSLVGGRVVGGYGHTTICLNAESPVVHVHFPGHH